MGGTGSPAGRDAPIGVFDSGIGGLTVAHAIHRRLPAETTVYLGDTARVPYGPKSAETVQRYTIEAADFLLSHGVKLIVIACNTATAHAAGAVASHSPVPVIGVIEPGARAAAESSTGGRIGVIGTRGTIQSGSYEREIKAIRPDAEVASAACPLFVPLVEEGWIEGRVAELTAERYLEPLLEVGIDSLVLGCTHYPLLKPLLSRIASGVALIDSAEATAAAVERLMTELNIQAPDGPPAPLYYVTDDAARFRTVAERFLEEPVSHLERVSLPEHGP